MAFQLGRCLHSCVFDCCGFQVHGRCCSASKRDSGFVHPSGGGWAKKMKIMSSSCLYELVLDAFRVGLLYLWVAL